MHDIRLVRTADGRFQCVGSQVPAVDGLGAHAKIMGPVRPGELIVGKRHDDAGDARLKPGGRRTGTAMVADGGNLWKQPAVGQTADCQQVVRQPMGIAHATDDAAPAAGFCGLRDAVHRFIQSCLVEHAAESEIDRLFSVIEKVSSSTNQYPVIWMWRFQSFGRAKTWGLHETMAGCRSSTRSYGLPNRTLERFACFFNTVATPSLPAIHSICCKRV